MLSELVIVGVCVGIVVTAAQAVAGLMALIRPRSAD